MGKIVGKIICILSIFLFILFLSFQTPVALADSGPHDTCKGVSFAEYKTNTPLPILTDNYNKARFIIDIDSVLPSYEYKMEFRCGAQSFTGKQGTKPVGNGKEIFNDLDKSSWFVLPGTTACEFSREPHEIWVTAEKDNKSYPVCRISYEVGDKFEMCKLDLLPTNPDPNNRKDITPATTLKVHGENLVSNEHYRLFFDNAMLLEAGKSDNLNSLNPLDMIANDLGTPPFNFFIPPDKMALTKQGRHKIDIRQRFIQPLPIFIIIPFKTYYGSALCPRFFTMGTPENPGKVLDETGLKECKGGPNCSTGKSLPCDPKNPNKPEIKTAIGCIHTNPADLMQDALKFGVGIGGGLAFLMMLLGAFQMLTSAGNPETLQAGRDRLTSAVIGLLVIIFSVLLLQIIGVDILGIPRFNR